MDESVSLALIFADSYRPIWAIGRRSRREAFSLTSLSSPSVSLLSQMRRCSVMNEAPLLCIRRGTLPLYPLSWESPGDSSAILSWTSAYQIVRVAIFPAFFCPIFMRRRRGGAPQRLSCNLWLSLFHPDLSQIVVGSLEFYGTPKEQRMGVWDWNRVCGVS